MIRTLVIALALVAAQDAAPSAHLTSTRAGGPIICPREEIDGATSVEDSSSTPASDLVESSATLTSATGASTNSVNSEPDSSVNPETEDSLDGSDLSEIPPRCAEPCTQWNQTLYKYNQCSDKSSPSDVASGTGRSCAADKAPGARVTCENLDYVAVCLYCIRGSERKAEVQEGLKMLNDECRNEWRFDVPDSIEGVVESGNSIPDPAMKSLRETTDNTSGSTSGSTSGKSSGSASGTTSGNGAATTSGNTSGQWRTASSVVSIAAAGFAALAFVLL